MKKTRSFLPISVFVSLGLLFLAGCNTQPPEGQTNITSPTSPSTTSPTTPSTTSPSATSPTPTSPTPSTSETPSPSTTPSTNPSNSSGSTSSTPSNNTTPSAPSGQNQGTSNTGAAPVYLDYTQDRYNSLKGKQPFALFFESATCTNCQKIEDDIRAKISTFPRDTQILKTNFSVHKTMAKNLGVTAAGTVVIFDKDGKVEAKLTNPNADQILTALKKVMPS